jgi:hypothetical protein
MLDDERPPQYDILRTERLRCILGAEAAERCGKILGELYHGIELERFQEAYARRAADYKMVVASLDAQMAALPRNEAYPTQSQTDFRLLVLARRAGQVTRREFGLRAWWIRRHRP